MTKPLDLVVPGHGTISGITNDVVPAAGSPLVVALPGGSYNASYFDVPGLSLLDRAAANGVRVVALDRPGYRRSSPLPAGGRGFARQAEVLTEAIDVVWSTLRDEHTGIVLLGHSMGAAVAVHVAAAHPGWPLLGLAVHGFGCDLPPEIADAFLAFPPGIEVTFTAEQRGAMYGPPGSYPADVVERSADACEPVPSDEILEINGRWAAEVATLAARVRVPVHYLLSAHDEFWVADEAHVRKVAGLFASAPRVSARLFDEAGHNVDHHRLGAAVHLQQIGFALSTTSSLYATG